MDNAAFPVDKIADDQLRRLTADEVGEASDVIVTFDWPGPQLQLESVDRGGRADARGVGFAPAPADSAGQRDAAERLVGGLTDSPPRWLDGAHVFIARATGTQLRSLARSALVKCVRPNRRLRQK